MEPSKLGFGYPISRTTLACGLAALLTAAYVLLPDGSAPSGSDDLDDADGLRVPAGAEVRADDRPEIWSISPERPYPGSTVIVVHSPVDDDVIPYAGKHPLRVLARRPGEMVAELPSTLEPGAWKIRLASADTVAFSERRVSSKPFQIRIRAPNWRRVFRDLVGGAALVVLGIGFLSRGVRRATGLDAARLVTRATRRRSFVVGFGAMLGAAAQSTTGAAGMLAGLAASRVLSVLPAAIAFLGAPLGAAVAPLLATGLVEPREGLVAVAVGVIWASLSADRRSHALARLVLGAGLVAFGLQVLQPGLEPFLSDAMLWPLAERLRSDDVSDLVLCAVLGSAVVAGLHGPAPLIVLILGVSQATGHWNLRTDLALLAGTGLGASLAALITTPLGLPARALARLNLCLGALSTLIGLLTVDLWAQAAELIVGPLASPLHWTRQMEMSDLGLRLAVAFGLSQMATLIVLTLLAPHLARLLERRPRIPATQALLPQVTPATLRASLARVLQCQHTALDHVIVLALQGVRARGHGAERALAEARRLLDSLLAGPVQQLPSTQESATLGGAAYTALQLQGALDALLKQTESMIDARIETSEDGQDSFRLATEDEEMLRTLHRLVSAGLDAAREALIQEHFLELDAARAREIQINRIEADARSALLEPECPPGLRERHLHVLQVVDAYEVAGNQIYRLFEVLGQSTPAVNLLAG